MPIAPAEVSDRLRTALRARHYSLRTEEAYVGWVKRYAAFHGERPPDELGEAEINAFLSHLAARQHIAASTQTQALSALLFLYRDVLGRPVESLGDVVRARRPERLPIVLTRGEVKAVLARLDGEPRLVATLLYGTGLRLMECLRLRVKDVDFALNQILVRDGKGMKDRLTMLPAALREPLRRHLAAVRALHEADLREGFGDVYLPDALARKYPAAGKWWGWQWVFPAASRSADPRAAPGPPQAATTMIYTHVLNRGGLGVTSPLDRM